MFLLLLFWGSDDRTGRALGGFLKEVPKVGMQTRRFFPERATIFPFPRAAKLDSLCHSRPGAADEYR